MDLVQDRQLHYYEFCIGHGFSDEILEEGTCNICGDVDARYRFSFENREEFLEEFLLEYFEYLQNDDYNLTLNQLKAKADDEELEYARKNSIETYNDLMKEFYRYER